MLISSENLSFGFEGEILLENLSFTLNEGDRVGLIGGNGEGKTTLLRLILGELIPEEGSLFRKNGIKIGYLAQNGGYDSFNTVYEEMCEIFESDKRAIASLREIEQKISQTDESTSEYRALCARYDSLNKQIAARDSYNFEVKVKTVLNGMGFAEVYEQKISTMSGGEKTRLKLCRLLLEEPELLILDEPTNHLDMKTLFWLEDYLATFKGAILVVSHDRYFLDRTVREIYELENKKLSIFKGNYSKYKTIKAETVYFKESAQTAPITIFFINSAFYTFLFKMIGCRNSCNSGAQNYIIWQDVLRGLKFVLRRNPTYRQKQELLYTNPRFFQSSLASPI